MSQVCSASENQYDQRSHSTRRENYLWMSGANAASEWLMCIHLVCIESNVIFHDQHHFRMFSSLMSISSVRLKSCRVGLSSTKSKARWPSKS